MDAKQLKFISKKLSLALRHRPENFQLILDEQGWCLIDQLIQGFNEQGIHLTRVLLEEVVATNDKQRFSFSEDGKYIRANQGHSVTVDLGYEPLHPPVLLYHGTAVKNLTSIQLHGLVKRNRHHVNLSADEATARKVGMRHGTPIILKIKAAQMAVAGHLFFRSANGVWLTDAVAPQFIEFPETFFG